MLSLTVEQFFSMKYPNTRSKSLWSIEMRLCRTKLSSSKIKDTINQNQNLTQSNITRDLGRVSEQVVLILHKSTFRNTTIDAYQQVMARDHENSISKKSKGFQSAALKRLITTCTLQKQKLTISSGRSKYLGTVCLQVFNPKLNLRTMEK